MNLVVSRYKNGNYLVILYSDGTKKYRMINPDDTEFKSEFPDSIDIKITNKCSNSCSYCHEKSHANGKEGDLEKIKTNILDQLPHVGIELAIGGGNPLEYSDLENLLLISQKKFNCRLTVKDTDFVKNSNQIIKWLEKELIGAVGISIESYDGMKSVANTIIDGYDYRSSTDWRQFIVFHIIVGVFPVKDLLGVLDYVKKVLILGFKQWGRAKDTQIDQKILNEWKTVIRRIRYDSLSGNEDSRYYYSDAILSFDNLALEQLDLKTSMLDSEWSSVYMGDEFSHSMYVDAVNEEFGETSRSPERTSWDDINIIDYFNKKL